MTRDAGVATTGGGAPIIKPISEVFRADCVALWATTYNIDLALFNEYLLGRLGDPPLNAVVPADRSGMPPSEHGGRGCDVWSTLLATHCWRSASSTLRAACPDRRARRLLSGRHCSTTSIGPSPISSVTPSSPAWTRSMNSLSL